MIWSILGPPRGGDGSLRAFGPPDLMVLCAGRFPSLLAWGCSPGGKGLCRCVVGEVFLILIYNVVRGSPWVGGRLGSFRLKIHIRILSF